jgi:hypothetical protein
MASGFLRRSITLSSDRVTCLDPSPGFADEIECPTPEVNLTTRVTATTRGDRPPLQVNARKLKKEKRLPITPVWMGDRFAPGHVC